jgi:hypothetical protein
MPDDHGWAVRFADEFEYVYPCIPVANAEGCFEMYVHCLACADCWLFVAFVGTSPEKQVEVVTNLSAQGGAPLVRLYDAMLTEDVLTGLAEQIPPVPGEHAAFLLVGL